MKRAVSYSVVLVCALMLRLPFERVSAATGANRLVSHTVIAASGSAAPAGGAYRAFSLVRLNGRSEIAFDAFLGGPSTTGVFVGDGTTTSMIALGGDPDAAAGTFGFVSNPFITAHG